MKVFHGIAAGAALSLVLLGTTSAFAGGGEGEEHHNHFFLGANGQALAVIAGGEVAPAGGGGAFFEFTVIENWLEIEAAVHVLSSHGELELPIDVLLKKPFHATKSIHPYVGLGPAVLPIFASEGTKVYGGLAFAGGSYFWFTQHVGWSVGLNYNLLFGGGSIKNEVGGTSGIVFGW